MRAVRKQREGGSRRTRFELTGRFPRRGWSERLGKPAPHGASAADTSLGVRAAASVTAGAMPNRIVSRCRCRLRPALSATVSAPRACARSRKHWRPKAIPIIAERLSVRPAPVRGRLPSVRHLPDQSGREPRARPPAPPTFVPMPLAGEALRAAPPGHACHCSNAASKVARLP